MCPDILLALPLQSDTRGLALEGAMALYNLQNHELVTYFCRCTCVLLRPTHVHYSPVPQLYGIYAHVLCSQQLHFKFQNQPDVCICLQLWERRLDTKALMAWNQDTVVLSFRGTASFRNVLADLKVMQSWASASMQHLGSGHQVLTCSRCAQVFPAPSMQHRCMVKRRLGMRCIPPHAASGGRQHDHLCTRSSFYSHLTCCTVACHLDAPPYR